jgi:hypothetical protein
MRSIKYEIIFLSRLSSCLTKERETKLNVVLGETLETKMLIFYSLIRRGFEIMHLEKIVLNMFHEEHLY